MKFNMTGEKGAKIMLLGEYPSTEANQSGVAWSGAQGRLLDQLLRQADISRFECLLGFVARERPPGGDWRFFFTGKGMQDPKPILMQWLLDLQRDIAEYRPNVIVALGALPLWALTGEWKLSDYRGSLMESSLVAGVKVIPTESPYSVQRMWELTFPVMMDMRKARRQSESPKMPKDNRVHVADASVGEFLDYADFLVNDPEVTMIAADTETSNPNNHINRIGYAHSGDFGMSFPLLNGRIPLCNENEELKVWRAIDEIAHCPKRLVYQNAAYDIPVLYRNNGILHTNLYMDTMIAAHVLWPESKRSLGFLASICLDVSAWKHTSRQSPGLYNAQDCTSTYAIAEVLEKELDRFGVREVYEMEMRQIPLAIYLQLHGMRIDRDVQQELLAEATENKRKVLDELNKITDGSVNFNSPAQLQKLIYERMGLPIQYKRRKRGSDPRKPTTDAEALHKLFKQTNNPVLKMILDYRKWEKLRKNVSNEPSPDSRYHTSYNICSKTSKVSGKVVMSDEEGGTDTGRWSSSASIIMTYGPGNLQNINYWARRMYVPDPGKVIIQADYIQAEAVVVAYQTNDQNLKKIFRNKEDLHCYTAAMMFGVPPEEVTKDDPRRKIGKMLRHAKNYSAGPGVIAKALEIKMSEAKKLSTLYDSINPLLHNWHMKIQSELNATRTLTTPMGRKRRFLDRWGDDLFRSAYAFVPQSTVGDLLNLSMTSLYEDYEAQKRMDILMQLHDAIYIQVDNNIEAIKYGMEKLSGHMLREIEVAGDTMVIDIDFSIGANWGQMDDARLVDGVVEIKGKDGWKEYICQTEK